MSSASAIRVDFLPPFRYLADRDGPVDVLPDAAEPASA